MEPRFKISITTNISSLSGNSLKIKEILCSKCKKDINKQNCYKYNNVDIDILIHKLADVQ